MCVWLVSGLCSKLCEATMATLSGRNAGNLKIGDVVMLYYNADKRFTADSGEKSGFILADLSGQELLITHVHNNGLCHFAFCRSNTQQLLTVQPSEANGLELPNLQCKDLPDSPCGLLTHYCNGYVF